MRFNKIKSFLGNTKKTHRNGVYELNTHEEKDNTRKDK